MNTPIETEVKIQFAGGAARALELLHRLGYTIQIPRTFESNQLFDRPDSSLRSCDEVLRLRQETGDHEKCWTLTYKGPAARERYKSREEIETGVADGKNLTLILERLGYSPGFCYEKYRTTFGTGHQPGIITVDETPLGTFLELEGSREWIDDTANHLGFSPADYVISSYATLWREYLQGGSTASPDMIFKSHALAPRENTLSTPDSLDHSPNG